MTAQFIRQARITFGKYGEEGRQTYQLRVSFNIQKSKKKEANTAQILVYNLNQESRAILGGDDVFVQLETKWQDEEQWAVICTGDVLDVSTSKQGVDYVTEINLGDGFRDLRDSTFSKSYPEGTNIRSVVQDMVSSFKRIDGKKIALDLISDARELITGGTFSGKTIDELERILLPFGLNPRIQNNDLIIEETLDTTETEAYLISNLTGLVGSPQTKTLTIDSKEKKGITFIALLNPRIDVGSIVKIESKFITGEYIVYNLQYMGDTEDGSWQVLCECLERD